MTTVKEVKEMSLLDGKRAQVRRWTVCGVTVCGVTVCGVTVGGGRGRCDSVR